MKENYISIAELSEKHGLNKALTKKHLGSICDDKKVIKGKMHYNRKCPEVKNYIKYGKWGMITKTTAKQDYKLKDVQLKKLHSFEVKNPHYSCAKPMVLYYHQQVYSYSNQNG